MHQVVHVGLLRLLGLGLLRERRRGPGAAVLCHVLEVCHVQVCDVRGDVGQLGGGPRLTVVAEVVMERAV